MKALHFQRLCRRQHYVSASHNHWVVRRTYLLTLLGTNRGVWLKSFSQSGEAVRGDKWFSYILTRMAPLGSHAARTVGGMITRTLIGILPIHVIEIQTASTTFVHPRDWCNVAWEYSYDRYSGWMTTSYSNGTRHGCKRGYTVHSAHATVTVRICNSYMSKTEPERRRNALLELPFTIIKRTYIARLEPAWDTVEMECVLWKQWRWWDLKESLNNDRLTLQIPHAALHSSVDADTWFAWQSMPKWQRALSDFEMRCKQVHAQRSMIWFLHIAQLSTTISA